MEAYSFALAILTALFHRARIAEGQWVDASQCEVGLFISGTTILDWSASRRIWSRYGNRSPYKPAAPHNVYPFAGDDRWLAIACFTDAARRALTKVAGHAEWANDGRFSDLAGRLAHQDALDDLVGGWTKSHDAYESMLALQGARVPAGVCQTAADRCDHDPQLAALSWLTEVTGTKIGRWPIAEVPVKLSESSAYIGGRLDRGAPLLRRGQPQRVRRVARDVVARDRRSGLRGCDLTAPSVGFSDEDEGRGLHDRSAGADEGDLDVLDLTLPRAPGRLQGTLDDVPQTVNAARAQATPEGVQREVAVELDASVLDEVEGFALLAEPVRLKAVDHRGREAVVDLGHIDIARAEP
jgi:CoA-transferase family III